jgi:hypothetical protein
MSKIKCCICHKNAHFAFQRPQRKKGKSQIVVVIVEAKLSELASKFKSDFSFVSFLSTNTSPNSAWYLDSGTSHHMIDARELFNSLLEEDSKLHIQLGNIAKYQVNGQGKMQFQLELGGSFDAQEVLYVLGLKKNLLSILVMEDKGYEVNLQRVQVFICPEGASPDTALRIGVWDLNLYRVQGQPVQALMHTSEILCKLWHMRMGHLITELYHY